MAPPKSKKPQNHPDGEQCEVCGLVLARRGDMPRHMRTHLEDKSHMLHRCTWEGCDYSSLQRCNVDTHYRTHTKEQTQVCPDCDFKSVDGGSLTRHRKRKHGYIPKPRKSRQSVAQPLGSTSAAPEPSTSAAASRARRRHQPYSRSPSESESSNRSSPTPEREPSTAPAPTDATTVEAFPVIIPLEHNMSLVFPEHKAPATYIDENEANIRGYYFWPSKGCEIIPRSPSPKTQNPAVDAHEMQDLEKEAIPLFSYLGWSIEDLIANPNASAMQEWDLSANANPVDHQVDMRMGEQCTFSLPPVVEEVDLNRMASTQPHPWDTTSFNATSYSDDGAFDYNAMFEMDAGAPPSSDLNWGSPEQYSPPSLTTSFESGINFDANAAASSFSSSTPALESFSPYVPTNASIWENPRPPILSPQPICPSPVYLSYDTSLEWVP